MALALPADIVLYRQGEASDNLYYLDTGAVAIAARAADGEQIVVAVHGPGTFFGARSLGEERHNTTATALLPSTIVRLSKSAVRDLLLNDPLFAQHFAMHMMQHATALEEERIDRAVKSTKQRLARMLLILASLDAGSDGVPVLARITVATLAAMLVAAPACIAKLLHEFRLAGHLEPGDALAVRSSLAKVLLSPQIAEASGPLDAIARLV